MFTPQAIRSESQAGLERWDETERSASGNHRLRFYTSAPEFCEIFFSNSSM